MLPIKIVEELPGQNCLRRREKGHDLAEVRILRRRLCRSSELPMQM